MDDYRGDVGFVPFTMLEVEIQQSVAVRAFRFFFGGGLG